jgi:hypothetical protein
VAFSLRGQTTGWMAIAFPEVGGRMVGSDAVFVCSQDFQFRRFFFQIITRVGKKKETSAARNFF